MVDRRDKDDLVFAKFTRASNRGVFARISAAERARVVRASSNRDC